MDVNKKRELEKGEKMKVKLNVFIFFLIFSWLPVQVVTATTTTIGWPRMQIGEISDVIRDQREELGILCYKASTLSMKQYTIIWK